MQLIIVSLISLFKCSDFFVNLEAPARVRVPPYDSARKLSKAQYNATAALLARESPELVRRVAMALAAVPSPAVAAPAAVPRRRASASAFAASFPSERGLTFTDLPEYNIAAAPPAIGVTRRRRSYNPTAPAATAASKGLRFTTYYDDDVATFGASADNAREYKNARFVSLLKCADVMVELAAPAAARKEVSVNRQVKQVGVNILAALLAKQNPRTLRRIVNVLYNPMRSAIATPKGELSAVEVTRRRAAPTVKVTPKKPVPAVKVGLKRANPSTLRRAAVFGASFPSKINTTVADLLEFDNSDEYENTAGNSIMANRMVFPVPFLTGSNLRAGFTGENDSEYGAVAPYSRYVQYNDSSNY